MIELILVIVIIGIIASVSLPKFANFKTRAIEKSEDAIVGAINSAIKMKFTENITAGSEPTNAWPAENPFSLMAQAPAYRDFFYPQDNVTWRYHPYAGTGWRILCPHWDGSDAAGNGSKGRKYIYKYSTVEWAGLQQGEFRLWQDAPH